MTTGLLIGRYQPAHITHGEVIEFVKQQGIEKLVIVKGSAQKNRIPRHPFTSSESISMLDMYLERADIEYDRFCVDDVSKNVKKDNEELTEQDLQQYEKFAKRIIELTPKFDVVATANPVIMIPFQRLGYDTITPISKTNCSSTYIRREYTLRGDRCEDLLLPEQVEFMDKKGLYDIMKKIGEEEFKEELLVGAEKWENQKYLPHLEIPQIQMK